MDFVLCTRVYGIHVYGCALVRVASGAYRIAYITALAASKYAVVCTEVVRFGRSNLGRIHVGYARRRCDRDVKPGIHRARSRVEIYTYDVSVASNTRSNPEWMLGMVVGVSIFSSQPRC